MLGLGLGLSRSSFVAQPPLLDTYSGAAAAYSLRKLRTAYSGSAIRVRESATNTEADIGFNADGSLDTTSLLAHTGANDGFVVTWYDQSGNGNDATQATAASQPQIVSGGSVLTEGSKPTIDYNGSSHHLAAVGFGTGNSKTLFTTHTFDSISGNPYVFSLGVLSTGFNKLFGYLSGSNEHRVFAGSTLGDATAAAINTQYLGYGLFDSTNSEVAVNGNTVTSGNAGTADNVDLVIGVAASLAGSYLNGNIQEIILYPSDQSSNRTAIESNINDYYSIYP